VSARSLSSAPGTTGNESSDCDFGYASGLSGIHAGNSTRPVALKSNVNESAKQKVAAALIVLIPANTRREERTIDAHY